MTIARAAGLRRPARGEPRRRRAVGLLGIELETRRRNRMNGTVPRHRRGGFAVAVDQSFGNCPQYIQARAPRFVADPAQRRTAAPGAPGRALLSPAAPRLVARRDTFFIASAAGATAQRRMRRRASTSRTAAASPASCA